MDQPPPEIKKQELEEKEIQERSAISARVVYHAVLSEGEDELKRPTSALAFSGLAAGLSMGFSLITEGLLKSHLPEAPWTRLIVKFGYSIGFLIVILGRQQLFTENTLTPILPLLKDKRLSTFWNILRLWFTVLLANWVGTMIFASAVANLPVLDDKAKETLAEIAHATIDPGFATVFVRAIFAGWLIALLVWLLPAAEVGRVAVIVIITYVVGLGGFSHIVAGSVNTFYLVAIHQISWSEYLGVFMLPAFLGNVIGGVSLVAFLNHAQVMAGGKE